MWADSSFLPACRLIITEKLPPSPPTTAPAIALAGSSW